MAINMLDPFSGFTISISADCPSQPSHPPENLLGNPKGFLAAYFKRPPVNLTIEFTQPNIVQIQRIVFSPRIFSQISTSAIISLQRFSEPRRLIYLCKGSWSPDTDLVVFDGSSNFRSHGILPKESENAIRGSSSGKKVAEFKLPRNGALGDVTALILTITSTNGSSAVAVTNLQIFGQPSLKVGKEVYSKVGVTQPENPLETSRGPQRRYLDSTSSIDRKIEKEACSKVPKLKQVEDPEKLPATLRRPRLDIPERFLDPLTYRVMLDPVCLPSSVTVDFTTLKLHERAQVELGRRLFDPYTGKQLTYRELRNDAALKMEIREFMAGHAKELREEDVCTDDLLFVKNSVLLPEWPR